jgi:hypothetical protein
VTGAGARDRLVRRRDISAGAEMISFVTSDTDDAVLLAIALRVSAAPSGRLAVEWNDTVRWRAVEAERVEAHTAARIDFRSVQGVRYVFVPLTLARYVDHVQPTVVGHPSFASTEALQAFYEGRGPRSFGWESEPSMR